MCGLLYIENFHGEPVNNDILDRYDAQKSRGTQGFGLFDGEYQHIVHATKEDKILKWLVKYDSSFIMFHHRWPTSTDNVKRAAHPFTTGDYFGDTQYILMHNGCIDNAYELFEQHQELGIEYQSLLQNWQFNDSEALLWDFALMMENKSDEMEAVGDMAFICVKKVKGVIEKTYFGRNSLRPLVMQRNDDRLLLASEGEGESIDTNKLYTWNDKLHRLTKRDMWFPSYVYTAKDSRHPEYYGLGNQDWEEDEDDYHFGYVYDDETQQWLSPQQHRELIEADMRKMDGVLDPTTPEQLHLDDANRPGGTWLGDILRAKFNIDLLQREGKHGLKVIEYEPNKQTQVMEPVERHIEYQDFPEVYKPLPGEVETRAMEYLSKTKGVFERAYWMIEADYSMAQEERDSADKTRKCLLLEGVMAHIESDPEYKSNSSVSSIWRALWGAQ